MIASKQNTESNPFGSVAPLPLQPLISLNVIERGSLLMIDQLYWPVKGHDRGDGDYDDELY